MSAPHTALVTDARVVFDHFGAPDLLQVRDHEPVPEPGPGQVRIRVEASSVQFTDTLIRRGKYPDLRQKPPLTPGYDLVGTVDAVGAGVTDWLPGDRVADLCMVGGNARYALRPAQGLTRVPDAVDAAEAATLVLSWMTAWQALVRTAKVQPGERVLVLGGNGAVGLATIGLARTLGIEVWATAAERHHDHLAALGARPLPREGWQDQVSAEGGVDVVVDGVCADGFVSSYGALREGGRLVAIGVSAPVNAGRGLGALVLPFLRLGWWKLRPDGKRAAFYSIASLRKQQPGWWTEDLAHLFALLERDEIRPEVAERLTLDEVADAHARLEAGGLQGKLVLEPWR